MKVAEDAANLDDNLCSTVSEPFAVLVAEVPEAPISLGAIKICEGDPIPPLKVEVEEDESVFWYTSASGGTGIASGNSFVPSTEGTYYAEAVKTDFSCGPGPRTPVSLTISSRPQVTDENRQLCSESEMQLDAGAGNFSYNWSTGAISRQITISQPGEYSVMVTNTSGCSSIKKFTVQKVDVAAIAAITSDGTTVIIKPANQGNFEYSLDGINFQESNIFLKISGGIYTAYARDLGL